MSNRKLLNLILTFLFISTLLLGGVNQAGAQPPNPPAGNGNGQQPKITQADRQAAADRAQAAGLETEAVGAAAMAMPGAAPHYFSHPNYANSPLPGNIVSEWNAIAQDLLQPAPMPGMPAMSSVSMSAAFVYLAYTQGAVYNALIAIEGGYSPYNSALLPADPNASRDAAVAAAAYGVLKNYFPMDATLDGKYAASLAAIIDGPEKVAGIAVGQAAAAEMIALRGGDVLSGDGGYVLPAPGPGVWEPTMLMPDGVTPMPPMDPWMAVLQPFLRAAPDQYRLSMGEPLALTDPQYTLEFNELKEKGGMMSMTRTAAEEEAAKFWTTNMVIQTQQAYRQEAAKRGLGLLETARLMAMGNMVATDSLIATFDVKYTKNFWRPVTAIQRADTDGNPDTIQETGWMPLAMTPNFPEFVAGHGSFVSAQAGVYEHFFGPQIDVDLDSSVTGTTRHYATPAEMRAEIIEARTNAGLHFRSSSVLAVSLGQQLVTDALATYFTPAPDLSAHALASGGIRKFVNGLPRLDVAGANDLGQYLSIADPDKTTYPGSDYYEIAVVEYEKQLHSDLPPTTLRGYVQLSTAVVPGAQVPLFNPDGTPILMPDGVTQALAVEAPQYLGATILAQKDTPVRVKFYNLLPKGEAGNLFIPVDTTVMGSGETAAGHEYMMANPTLVDPQNPMCSDVMKAEMVALGYCYPENRATLHLHGGISPWISDGTPHQWITPAGENTAYPQGVSVRPVPDMGDSGAANDGVMTFFYTNQQSARLMFYHDHAWGITRLNVYAGEAAGYIIQDPVEQGLVDSGTIPGLGDTIPLIVQDKTFVPSESQLAVSDETWDIARWGGYGDLWIPHVYSPAQNPGDASGVNQFGRWAYGPWFWPPTSAIEYGPVNNPYYDPSCNPDLQWCEPPLMPGVPNLSMGMEVIQRHAPGQRHAYTQPSRWNPNRTASAF